jgi:hypothetical protein
MPNAQQRVLCPLSVDVQIQQATNHLLVLRLVLLRLPLEEIHAPPTEPEGNLDRVFLVDQLRRGRQKILDHLDFAQRLVSVFTAFLHGICPFLFASNRRR